MSFPPGDLSKPRGHSHSNVSASHRSLQIQVTVITLSGLEFEKPHLLFGFFSTEFFLPCLRPHCLPKDGPLTQWLLQENWDWNVKLMVSVSLSAHHLPEAWWSLVFIYHHELLWYTLSCGKSDRFVQGLGDLGPKRQKTSVGMHVHGTAAPLPLECNASHKTILRRKNLGLVWHFILVLPFSSQDCW